MRVLVIAHRDDGDPGWVGQHLEEVHGAVLMRAWREEPDSWPGLEGVDLVVSLGSDWSVYWDRVAGAVGAETALIAAAHHQRRPILGICFGAQIAAHALDGSVTPAPEPELGWYDLEVLPGAPFDAGPWFQWHADRFDPPPSARVLARTPRAVQAFAIDRTLAVQFHPEVTLDMVEHWTSGEGQGELRRLGVDRDVLLADTAARAPERREAVAALVEATLRGLPA